MPTILLNKLLWKEGVNLRAEQQPEGECTSLINKERQVYGVDCVKATRLWTRRTYKRCTHYPTCKAFCINDAWTEKCPSCHQQGELSTGHLRLATGTWKCAGCVTEIQVPTQAELQATRTEVCIFEPLTANDAGTLHAIIADELKDLCHEFTCITPMEAEQYLKIAIAKMFGCDTTEMPWKIWEDMNAGLTLQLEMMARKVIIVIMTMLQKVKY